MSADDSFFGHLTNLTDKNEATDLSRLLIKVVAYNACLAKRNTLTTYRLVEGLRDVCNEIGTLVTEVDNLATDSDVNNWGAYDKYTKAIDPLEEFLWKLLDFTDEELLGKSTTVDEVIRAVEAWETSREKLRQLAIEALTPKKFGDLKISANFDFEKKHDDLVLLLALCNGISTHSLGDKDVAGGQKKTITGVKNDATSIAQIAKTGPEDLIFECIRCTMLVHGAMTLSQTLPTVKSSAPVWENAKELLGKVSSHLRAPQKVSVSDLKKGWDDLEALLKKLEAALPESYLALRKLAKTVRRPFHQRTLALVKMCRDLAEAFSKDNTTKVAANLPPLEVALTAATNALVKGKVSVLDVVAGADLTEIEEAYNEGAKMVDACWKIYNLKEGQGTAEMAAAAAKDQVWIGRLTSSKVTELETKTPKSTNEVTVKVSYTTATGTKQKQYKVDVDTKLSMILWKVVSEKPDAFPRDKLVSAYFETGTPPKKLAFDGKVGSTDLSLTLKT